MLISLATPPINFWRSSKLWESRVTFALSNSALFSTTLGKIRYPQELSKSGSLHEQAGQALLLTHGAILWSGDGIKCALLINAYPHAAFDFEAKRGYCRTNFPNFPKTSAGCWDSSDHHWSDEAIAWLD